MSLIGSETQKWAFANLPYFRTLGFFSDLVQRTDAEILTEIEKRYIANYSDIFIRFGKTPPTPPVLSFPLESPMGDLHLLAYDSTRVWWEDTECVYPPEELAYQDAFWRWSKITRGAFAPSQIEETWGGTEDDPELPSVRIVLPNGTLTITPLCSNDWFDLTTLTPINHYMRDSGIRLELFKQFDQTAFVVALTAGERKQLERARKWKFRQFDDSFTPTWELPGRTRKQSLFGMIQRWIRNWK